MPVVSKQAVVNSSEKFNSAKRQRVAASGILSRIQAAGNSERGIKIVVFGKSKSGKTTFAASFQKPSLFLVASGSDETRSLGKTSGIETVRIEDVDELDTLLKYYVDSGKYKTFVLDHASGFQDLVLKKVLGLAEAPVQLSWGVAKQEQWGYVAQGMKENLRKILALSGDVVILAQERTNNEETNSEILLPSVTCALTPSVAGWLGPAVDYVAHTFVRLKVDVKEVTVAGVTTKISVPSDKKEFCLRITPHPIYATGGRFPKGQKVPDIICDPTWEIFAKLANG